MTATYQGEPLVTAYAEAAAGAGWRNPVVWVITRARTGELVEHAIQPDEQTDTLRWLFPVSKSITTRMVAAVGQMPPLEAR